MKAINIVFALVFALFAAVQYNDPDPFVWVFFYSVAALLCFRAALGKPFKLGSITLIIFSSVWMVLLIPSLADWIFAGMPSEQEAPNSNHVELLREFFGLLLLIVSMFFQLRSFNNVDNSSQKISSTEHADYHANH